MSSVEWLRADPFTVFDEYRSMDFEGPLVGHETTMLGPLIPHGPSKEILEVMVVQASVPSLPTGAVLPSAQPLRPELKGKGKGVRASKEPKKRKGLGEMSTAERISLPYAKQIVLTRQEGYLLKH